MSLTTALVIVAALALAALVAHSVWSARKAGPRRADPGFEPSRVEPSMDGLSVQLDEGAGAAAGAEPADGALQTTVRVPTARRTSRVDALIDAVAPLTLEAPVSGEHALAHLPPTRRAGTKPFHIEGLNTESGDWELPRAGQHYGEFQAGVQLANRNGPLNEIEYSEFAQKVQDFAEGVGAMPDLPDMLDAVARARELDTFASQHDAQLSMQLRARDVAWSVGYVHQCAARHGFVPGLLPGRLVLPADEEGAPPLLVLSFDAQAALAEDPNSAALRELTLSLDVPQTGEALEPFAAWQASSKALADDMDASVCDESGRPITLQAFTAIREELRVLYGKLDARELSAGSPAARRLFS
jgi:hypothetical protein